MFVFLYWARNAEGAEIHFMGDIFHDVGSTIEYNGEQVTIYDYAAEFVPED